MCEICFERIKAGLRSQNDNRIKTQFFTCEWSESRQVFEVVHCCPHLNRFRQIIITSNGIQRNWISVKLQWAIKGWIISQSNFRLLTVVCQSIDIQRLTVELEAIFKVQACLKCNINCCILWMSSGWYFCILNMSCPTRFQGILK